MVMKSIKRLPRTVHSSMRSSVFLFDLTRVVEELIFNSVDAGATKVHLFVSLEACYVRVEDDGCGITRDGLVLLGERYATSKFQTLADMDANTESLGSRGEALGSLSDISLLEIITKARGMPNGYRKVMKGWKCLFLGIDDHSQDVGTTVIVRDLFYNQPIRRRYMQSSQKKVLDSVKKCVVRTALVHPEVSFKVTDIESENELLCTVPSLSPLPLVSNIFGIEVASCLHEINHSDKALRLLGYLSGPADNFSMKAFQYLYINSRFICKGPVHKLINNLASSSRSSLNLWSSESEFQNGKRQKAQRYPAYMLNLHCPLSGYDITFEPSKTIVEFKDWSPVLSFIEQAVRCFWKEIPAHSLPGESHDQRCGTSTGLGVKNRDMSTADISESSKMTKKKCGIQTHQNSFCLSSFTKSVELPLENFDVYLNHKRSSGGVHRGTTEVTLRQNETASRYAAPDALEVSDSKHDQIVSPKSITTLWVPKTSFPAESRLLLDQTIDGDEKDDYFGSVWVDDLVSDERNLKEGPSQSRLAGYLYEKNHSCKVPFLLRCSEGHNKPRLKNYLVENVQANSTLFSSCKGSGNEFDNFRRESEYGFLDDAIDVVDSDYRNVSSCFPTGTPCQYKVADFQSSSNVIRELHAETASDVLYNDITKPYYHDRLHFSDKTDICTRAVNHSMETASSHQLTDLDWVLGSPYSLSGSLFETVSDFSHKYASERNYKDWRGLSSRHYWVAESMDEFQNNVQDSSTEAFSSLSYASTTLEDRFCSTPKRKVYYKHHSGGINFENVFLPNKLNDETCLLSSESSITDNTDNYNKHAIHTLNLRSRRSHSAPPSYKPRRKFSIVPDCSATTACKNQGDQFFNDANTLQGASFALKELSKPCGVSQPYIKQNLAEGTLSHSRTLADERPIAQEINVLQNIKAYKRGQCSQICSADEADDGTELEYSNVNLTKWRKGDSHPTLGGNRVHNLSDHEDDILDISSGLLHLAGSSLVPESINRDSLEDAKVLLQVDRKFIPIVASGILAFIDQHAADERIRLEELRQKVMCGEGCKIAHLDSEQELVLPEIGFQLLLNYAEQIQKWGWICDVGSLSSESFTKNLNLLKKRPCGVALIAVPCILGINLTDKDLLEFLEQLAETDGSSTTPPSVLRVLNFKACRGAIMFGDSLLPSECSLIVEELKATSLCFQCAHGRPTTVPLVGMAELHKQLAKLQLQQAGGTSELWHGLRQHRPCMGRARSRLDSD